MLYVDYNNEVETKSLIKWCLLNGKQVFVPVVAKDNKMLAARVTSTDFDEHYEKDCYGIPEPKTVTSINPERLDVVIAPMVASDRQGYRLGYGGGYYDRFLAEAEIETIGICFDFQLVDELPRGEYDKKMNKIITDMQIIDISLH